MAVRSTLPDAVIKFCPRCGSSHFVTSDGGRSFLCEECKFNYYLNNSAAVACLIFDDHGRLMLGRRAVEPDKGKYDLPGGFVEPRESAEQAVIREIQEELGVQVTKADYLVSFPNEYVFSSFSVFTLDLAYVCEVDDLSKVVPGDDVESIEFVDPKTIEPCEVCSTSILRIIKTYLEQYNVN